MVILVLVSLFLASPLSLFFWQHLPLPQLVQFPWRFLALTAFSLAIFAGRLPKKIATLVTVLVIIFTLPYLKIDRAFHPESFYTTNDDTTTVKNEYMPKWVKIDPTNRSIVQQTVYFPGVKVVVNGQEVEPEIDANGIIKTPGPVVFRETPLRLLADLLSLFGILICVMKLLKP